MPANRLWKGVEEMPTKRIRRFGALGVGATLLLAAMSGAASAPATGSGVEANSTQADTTIVSQWNAVAQTETLLLRPTAHGQMRGIAMVQGAVYDAVNAIDRSRKPYLLGLNRVRVGRRASQDAAAATAAYRVLLAITPTTRHEGLGTAYQATLASIPDGPSEQGGVRAGEAAAAAMLAARQNDGFMAPFTPAIGTDAGDWRPIGWPGTPAFDPDGWVGSLKPFLIRSPSQHRTKGPDALTSAAYARDFAEVKEVGALSNSTRTPDQTAAAVFWQFAPIALWNPLARDLASRFELDTADQARLYALVNLAGTDAAIACWNDKYHWNFWRPRAAIREADSDGNPGTVADPSWESLFAPATQTAPPLGTPPFPDHPSGHGCLSGAVLQTMADFFGRDRVAFTVVGGRSLNGAPIPSRRFERFSQARTEIIDARVWGGIHFRTADRQGAVLGRKVAKYVRKNYFRPVK
jgi:PAP2 superfamily